jgi:flagellar hook-associated protein 2
VGTITTGIGLISGLNTAQIIDQLMAIEARPQQLAQRRLAELQFQQTAFIDINARLLAFQTAAGTFKSSNTFLSSKATSSNTDVLTASAGPSAAQGTYNFNVHRLVSTHQVISRGFADKDASAVGAAAFSFEIGGGQLATNTELSMLNGGEGIDRGKIEITDSQGNTEEIDLSTAVTVNDVLEAINSNGGIEVTASVVDDHFVITDDNAGEVTVSNLYGSSTADSLGITGNATGDLVGSSVFGLSEYTGLSSLNNGTGVHVKDGAEGATYDMRITVGGVSKQISLGELEGTGDDEGVVQARAGTIGDVIDRINEELEGAATAQISSDGKRIEIVAANPADTVTVEEVGTGTTARDLGLLGTDTGTLSGSALIAGMNTTLLSRLNGGAGLDGANTINITDRDGNLLTLSNANDYDSVDDLIRAINAEAVSSGVAVTASLNDSGNGLQIVDSSGGTGNLVISGDAADALNLTADVAATSVNSGNLQIQYVAEATRLDSLLGGRGIGEGSFTITDAYGVSSTITVGSGTRTMRDLIDLINSRGIEVEARINDNGDGLLIEATTRDGGDPGTQTIEIEDSSGTVARDLGLVGEAADVDNNFINGSFEQSVSFDDTDTLQDIADKINSAGVGVQAVIVNDGTGATPYRLSITSSLSGTKGLMSIDTGGIDLGLSTLTEAQDAVVFFGSADPADAVLLTSSTNTLDNAIEGVTIDLNGTSRDPVELVITRDTSKIEQTITSFVEAFNEVIERLDYYDSYNAETEERGILLGDSTVAQIRQAMFADIQSEALNIDSQYTHLYEVGISIGEGSQLTFDTERFREALENDPEGVAALFGAREIDKATEEEILPGVTTPSDEETFTSLGVAEQLKELAKSFTNSIDGLLTNRNSSLESQMQLQQNRITDLDTQLENKRSILEQQFLAMEMTLAQLQQQQSSLSMISTIG